MSKFRTDIQTIPQLIEFYESIPDDKWCVKEYQREDRYCALGHLGFDQDNDDTPLWIDGVCASAIMRSNDGNENSKVGVIEYLRSLG